MKFKNTLLTAATIAAMSTNLFGSENVDRFEMYDEPVQVGITKEGAKSDTTFVSSDTTTVNTSAYTPDEINKINNNFKDALDYKSSDVVTPQAVAYDSTNAYFVGRTIFPLTNESNVKHKIYEKLNAKNKIDPNVALNVSKFSDREKQFPHAMYNNKWKQIKKGIVNNEPFTLKFGKDSEEFNLVGKNLYTAMKESKENLEKTLNSKNTEIKTVSDYGSGTVSLPNGETDVFYNSDSVQKLRTDLENKATGFSIGSTYEFGDEMDLVGAKFGFPIGLGNNLTAFIEGGYNIGEDNNYKKTSSTVVGPITIPGTDYQAAIVKKSETTDENTIGKFGIGLKYNIGSLSEDYVPTDNIGLFFANLANVKLNVGLSGEITNSASEKTSYENVTIVNGVTIPGGEPTVGYEPVSDNMKTDVNLGATLGAEYDLGTTPASIEGTLGLGFGKPTYKIGVNYNFK